MNTLVQRNAIGVFRKFQRCTADDLARAGGRVVLDNASAAFVKQAVLGGLAVRKPLLLLLVDRRFVDGRFSIATDQRAAKQSGSRKKKNQTYHEYRIQNQERLAAVPVADRISVANGYCAVITTPASPADGSPVQVAPS